MIFTAFFARIQYHTQCLTIIDRTDSFRVSNASLLYELVQYMDPADFNQTEPYCPKLYNTSTCYVPTLRQLMDMSSGTSKPKIQTKKPNKSTFPAQ